MSHNAVYSGCYQGMPDHFLKACAVGKSAETGGKVLFMISCTCLPEDNGTPEKHLQTALLGQM